MKNLLRVIALSLLLTPPAAAGGIDLGRQAPPASYPAGNSYGLYQVFSSSVPDFASTFCPGGVPQVSWIWAANNSTYYLSPDPNLGKCVPQFAYWPMVRFAWDTDTTKVMPWFEANEPQWVLWLAPQTVTGTITGGSASITSLSADPTVAANGIIGDSRQGFGSYLIGNAGCLPGGVEVTAVTSSTLTMSANALVGCAGGTQTFQIMTPAYEFNTPPAAGANANYTPITFFDPTYQQWALTGCRTSANGDCSMLGFIRNGFSGISIDNGATWNTFNPGNASGAAVGHFAGATGPCATTAQPSCGGAFTPDFSSAEFSDVFRKAVTQWVKTVVENVHALGARVALNGGLKEAPEIYAGAALCNLADICLTETPALGGCSGSNAIYLSGANWITMRKSVLNVHVPYAPTDDETCFDTVGANAGASEEYALATLLIDAKPNTYYAAVGTQDAAKYVAYDPSWLVNCGTITDATPSWFVDAGGSYERDLPKCLVVANPSTTATTSYTVPTPPLPYTQWEDAVTGDTVTPGTYSLNPSTNGATGNSAVLVATP